MTAATSGSVLEQPKISPGPTPARPYFRNTVGLEGNKIHEVKYLRHPRVFFSSKYDFAADLVRDLLNGIDDSYRAGMPAILRAMEELDIREVSPPALPVDAILSKVKTNHADFFVWIATTAPAPSLAPEINADGNAGKAPAQPEPRAPYVGFNLPKMPPCNDVNHHLAWAKNGLETALYEAVRFCRGEMKRAGKPFSFEGFAQLSLAAVILPSLLSPETKERDPNEASRDFAELHGDTQHAEVAPAAVNPSATTIVTQAQERLASDIADDVVNQCFSKGSCTIGDIRQSVVEAVRRVDAARRGAVSNLSPSAKSA